MSLLKYKSFVDRTSDRVPILRNTRKMGSQNHTFLILIPSVILSIFLAGCSDNFHPLSSQELIEFENAGPVPPTIDMDRIVRAKIGGGPYHVVIGDALELTMPAVVRFITAKDVDISNAVTPYISRVNENGNITLPIVGDIEAAGRTLSQIETDIINAYYPKHVVTRPSVFARVLEYRTSRVSITGAVRTPGIYSLRSDQMSLVALIMEAGGIIDQGAASIRIIHSEQAMDNNDKTVTKTASESFQHPQKSESIILPVKDFNIPFADVALQGGDSVIVERLGAMLFTVMGLVNRPDNLPYPPDAQYTLMQAIGFGGGLNLVAEPRYATVYRLKRDGSCVSATFPIRGDTELADASNTLIKPGDIIAVEHTPRTRTAMFLDRVFRINVGTYWSLNDNRY